MKQILSYLCLLTLLPATTGCEEEDLTYTEVKRPSEELSPSDVRAFLEVVDHMPGRKLQHLPNLFLPLPAWNPERTLPISDLVDAEQLAQEDRWKTERLLGTLPESRQLDRWFRRKRMTREQFLGLTISIGAALSRSTIRENQDLKAMLAKGDEVVATLRSDRRPFNTLSPEAMHDVLHKAAWITRHDRARRLLAIPHRNVSLVLQHWDRLAELFPSSLTTNPFDDIADRLDEQGIPFEELPGADSLDVLTWERDKAIVGRDDPLDLDGEST